MDKIYRRPTQHTNTFQKKTQKKNRVRNTILNFRVSPKEKALIEARIAMSGLLKAEFFIQSCLYQTILVKGNIKSFTVIRNKIEELSAVIIKNPKLEELEPEQVESLRTILEIMMCLSKQKKV